MTSSCHVGEHRTLLREVVAKEIVKKKFTNLVKLNANVEDLKQEFKEATQKSRRWEDFINKYFTFEDEEDGAENKVLVELSFFFSILIDMLELFDTKDEFDAVLSALSVADEGLAKMRGDISRRWNAMHKVVRTATKLKGLLGNLQKTWLQGQNLLHDKGANMVRVYVFDKLRQHFARGEKAMRVARGVAKKMAGVWKEIVEPAKSIGLFHDPTVVDIGGDSVVEAFGHDIGESL